MRVEQELAPYIHHMKLEVENMAKKDSWAPILALMTGQNKQQAPEWKWDITHAPQSQGGDRYKGRGSEGNNPRDRQKGGGS